MCYITLCTIDKSGSCLVQENFRTSIQLSNNLAWPFYTHLSSIIHVMHHIFSLSLALFLSYTHNELRSGEKHPQIMSNMHACERLQGNMQMWSMNSYGNRRDNLWWTFHMFLRLKSLAFIGIHSSQIEMLLVVAVILSHTSVNFKSQKCVHKFCQSFDNSIFVPFCFNIKTRFFKPKKKRPKSIGSSIY